MIAITHPTVTLDFAAKIPDVIVHSSKLNWLLLIEAVSCAGSVDGKRSTEPKARLADSQVGLVFVTAFENRRAVQAIDSDQRRQGGKVLKSAVVTGSLGMPLWETWPCLIARALVESAGLAQLFVLHSLRHLLFFELPQRFCGNFVLEVVRVQDDPVRIGNQSSAA